MSYSEKQQFILDVLDGRRPIKVRKAPVQREHYLQVECINWLHEVLPDVIVWATPNGAFCGYKQARKLIAEGMTTGVPDLFIAMPRKGYHGLFIEMKDGKRGRVREEQMDMMCKLSAQHYQCAVCRTKEQFQQIVKNYFS